MKSKLTRERIEQYANDPRMCNINDEIRELARMALAAMDSEPFAYIIQDKYERERGVEGYLSRSHVSKYVSQEDISGHEITCTPLYRHAQPAPAIPSELHPDTQKLVTDFCTALAEKLYKAQLKYGYDADWKRDGWPTQCQAHFHQHIAKGDPRDVAAYCAFMWYHGWKTEAEQPAPVLPDEMLCDFYEVSNWPDLVRELVKHVEQLQDSAKRNVKPWEDTFPETLLPAYIDRIKQADEACRSAASSDDYQHLKNVQELYHGQEKRLFKIAQRIKGPAFDKYSHSPSQAIDVLEAAIFGEDDACRAAMPQAQSLHAIKAAPELGSRPKVGEVLHANSPVIPDDSADTKRLDWLDAQNKRLNEYYGTSYGWKFDANFQRNAMMLNDSNYPAMTVRQAIDEAIAAAPTQENI